jgi:lipoyl(octanoyl) transferase
MIPPIKVSHYKEPVAYSDIFQAMRTYTLQRTENTPDAIWLLQHEPVFTQGQAGKAEHILQPGDIPIIQSDRGGQVTYHGPGQLMIYTLFDLKRLNFGLKRFVRKLEQSIIRLLHQYGIDAHTQCNAPGVYVNDAKICSMGLRLRHHRVYHGLSLNIKMDLSPFTRINPCGFRELKMTQISDFVPDISVEQVSHDVLPYLNQELKPEIIPSDACGVQHER